MVSGIWKSGGPFPVVVSVIVTLCPLASDPLAGDTARPAASAAGTVITNFPTGPPAAVSVKRPE